MLKINKKSVFSLLIVFFLVLSFNVVVAEDLIIDFKESSILYNESYTIFKENLDYGVLNSNLMYSENFDNPNIIGIDFISYEYPEGSTKVLEAGKIEIIPNTYIWYNDFDVTSAGGGGRSGGIVLYLDGTHKTKLTSNFSIFVNLWRYSSTLNVIFFNDDVLVKSITWTNSGLQYGNIWFSSVINEEIFFDKIYIGFYGTNDIFQFSKLNFTNIIDVSNNQLPNVNVTSEKPYYCINETDDVLIIPLNYSIYDYENDTIYYSLKKYDSYSENTTILFYERFCRYLFGFIPLCTNNKNYDFLLNTYYPTENVCEISQNSYNESMFNLYFENDIYGLRLNDCHNSDKSFYYDLDIPTNNLNYITEIRQIHNNDVLNVSLLSEDLNEISRIQLNTQDNRLYVNYYNGTDLINIGNISKQDNTLIEFYDVNVNNNNYVFRVWESGVNLPRLSGTYQNFTIPILSDNSIKYVKHNINDVTDVIIMGLQFRGVTSFLNFTQEQITNFTIYNIGSYYYTIYTTDELNKELNKYNTNDINFNVVSCDVYIDADNFMKEIYPNTKWESLNEFIFALRQPYLIFVELNILNSVLFAFKIGLIFIFYSLYKKMAIDQERDHKDIFRSIFIYVWFIVSIMYIMLLMEKTFFITFSVIGILYFSNEILNISGNSDDNGERNFAYVLAMFSVISYIWFGIFSVAFGVNMGLPNISNISFNNPIMFLTSSGNFILSLLFFNIPEIPIIINLIIVLLRLLGLISLVIYIYEKINPLN